MKEKRKIFIEFSLLGMLCILMFLSLTYFFGNYAGAFQTKILIENKGEVDFDDSIMISFSDSMITNNFSEYIKIVPQTEVDYSWESANKVLKITPKNSWKLEEKYKVSIVGLKSIFLVESDTKLSFNTVKYPGVESFYPEDKARDVVIDIEDPGLIKFNKPLSDFNLKIKVVPEKKLIYNINEEKNEVQFAFEDGYEKGQEYQVSLYLKHKRESKLNYKEVYKMSFLTESPPSSEWDKDFATRLDQAKKFTKAKINNGKYIDINLSVQIMTIFENGEIVDSFLISSGKRGMDTPKGNFKINNKHPRPWSKKYSLYMPYWMAIVPSGEFGIHELPEWPGGYKEGQNHLGTPVSHGCVRLGVGPAELVYNWVEIGTPVVVY